MNLNKGFDSYNYLGQMLDRHSGLLRYCLSARIDGTDSKEQLIEILASNLDWDKAIKHLRAHKLEWIFLRLLDTYRLEEYVPAMLVNDIRKRWYGRVVYLMLQEQELKAAIAILSEKGIDTIVMKGAFLNSEVYSVKDIRVYNDLDILLRMGDIPDALSILKSSGYELVPKPLKVPWRKPNQAYSLMSPKAVHIELQHTVVNNKNYWKSTKVDMDTLWQQASNAMTFGLLDMNMRPEHLLMHLCLHLSIQHRYDTMILFRDIKEVIDRYGDIIDWDYFVMCTREWQLCTYMYLTLLLSSNIWPGIVPKSILSDIEPQYISARIVGNAFGLNGKGSIHKYRFHIATLLFPTLRDSFLNRIQAVIEYPFLAAITASKNTKIFNVMKATIRNVLYSKSNIKNENVSQVL